MINCNEEYWPIVSDDYEPLIGGGSGGIGDDQGLDFLGSKVKGM